MPHSENTNILIVYVTDETPERDTLNSMRETIRKVCSRGGLMIIRYRETFNYVSKARNRDLIIKALQRIKSMVAVYPSKNIPIIQEQLAL